MSACIHRFSRAKRLKTYLATANHTFILIIPKAALIADADKRCGANVGIADGTFAVAFIAQAADGNAGLLAAHYEIAVDMLVYYGAWGEPPWRGKAVELTDDDETLLDDCAKM